MIDKQYAGRVIEQLQPEIKKEISTKQKELHDLKSNRYAKNIDTVSSKIVKALKVRLKNRQVLKEQNKVTVVENQPVYSKDKSRYFKTAWEEERRQLFFK